MPSFRAIAESRRGHFQNVVAPLTAPVLRLLPDGEPDFWCSGFIISLGDEAILVSASHALEAINPALQFANGAISELINPVITARGTTARTDPLNDIASVRLTSHERAALVPQAVCPVSTFAPFEYRTAADAYIVFGYREKHQRFDHADPMFYNQPSSIMVGPFESRGALARSYSAEEVLLLGTTPANFQGPTGRGGVPSFKGMSGSPVWRFNPHEDYSLISLPPLVGMLVGRPPETPKALLVLRIGLVCEFLAAAFDDLATFLPRFRGN